MDANFHDISVALYRQDGPVGARPHVQPEARRRREDALARGRDGGARRARTARRSPRRLPLRHLARGGREADLSRGLQARSHDHADLEAARAATTRRRASASGRSRLGDGAYRIVAEGVESGTPSRAPAVAAGLAKLATARRLGGRRGPSSRSPADTAHDALVGLLLPRAINVRAVAARAGGAERPRRARRRRAPPRRGDRMTPSGHNGKACRR